MIYLRLCHQQQWVLSKTEIWIAAPLFEECSDQKLLRDWPSLEKSSRPRGDTRKVLYATDCNDPGNISTSLNDSWFGIGKPSNWTQKWKMQKEKVTSKIKVGKN